MTVTDHKTDLDLRVFAVAGDNPEHDSFWRRMLKKDKGGRSSKKERKKEKERQKQEEHERRKQSIRVVRDPVCDSVNWGTEENCSTLFGV